MSVEESLIADFVEAIEPDLPNLLGEPVDLVQMIHDGIPDPEYVPGCEGWLRAGKRYLMPAPAGTGKSLLMLVVSAGIVQAGGSVVVLDVENGSDEYARRLECILAANDSDGSLAELCQQRLTYYEWPSLSLDWSPGEWVESISDADVVVFDSSRFVLSSVGLEENSSDDYARFATALLMPLSQSGVTTVTLDNTGQADKTRSRGTKAKDDLNEVVYALSSVGAPDTDTTAILKMTCTRQRFGGLRRHLEARIGGGVYELPRPSEPSLDGDGNWQPTWYMEKVSRIVENEPGILIGDILSAVGKRHDVTRTAVEQLIREGYVRVEVVARGRHHHSTRPYREAE